MKFSLATQESIAVSFKILCMHAGACARVFKFNGRHKNISTFFLNNYIYFRIIYKKFNDISIGF